MIQLDLFIIPPQTLAEVENYKEAQRVGMQSCHGKMPVYTFSTISKESRLGCWNWRCSICKAYLYPPIKSFFEDITQ